MSPQPTKTAKSLPNWSVHQSTPLAHWGRESNGEIKTWL